MNIEELAIKLKYVLDHNKEKSSSSYISSRCGVKKEFIEDILQSGQGSIFQYVGDVWLINSGVSARDIESLIRTNKNLQSALREASWLSYQKRKKIMEKRKRMLDSKSKLQIVSPHLSGGYNDDVTKGPKNDPFSYGKKKSYAGYADGAYAFTNVPAGGDRVVKLSRSLIKSPFGRGRTQASRVVRTDAEKFKSGDTKEYTFEVNGAPKLLKRLKSLGIFLSKNELPRFSANMNFKGTTQSKYGKIMTRFSTSSSFRNDEKITVTLRYY